MLLKKLTLEEIPYISDKKIICYEKSDSYLQEFQTKFSLTKNIVAIVDDFKRNQGSLELNGNSIEVVSSEYLKTASLDNTVIIIMSDYFNEAFEKLSQILNVVDNCSVVYFFANKETEIELQYREKYENQELENIIVFRSGPHAASYVKGMDFADNARALFEYMIRNNYNKKYELVWIVKEPKKFEKYQKLENVSFLPFDGSISEVAAVRDEYYRTVCLAKYIFFTDAYGFARNCREDQIRIQLWHGCGFKTRVNFVRCEKRYEYTTVISDLYAKIHEDIYGLHSNQMLVTGYAKQDWLFEPIEKEKMEEIYIPKAEKYIFWLPTFRTTEKELAQLNEYQLNSDTGLPIINSYEKLKEINDILEEKGMVLVVKLHPFQNRKTINCEGCSNIVLLDNEQLVEKDIQINQILGWADALISDYSSAAVDYMLLDRPIAFTLDDVEEYGNSRGFVFENIREWLPGKEIFGFGEFLEFVKEISEDIDLTKEKRRKLTMKMHKYSDNQSCKRIIETLGI